MKVLFAVNNEKISEAIIKKYQTMYKEIISWKNVYFFNAIIKELQKDKSYDRIVIGEDLEPYANSNYEVIDNLLFDKLDGISDEASNSREGDIPIILIATDRRDKGDSLLVKLFGIGIYNVILGKDRRIEDVCKLIYQPRSKKEAKSYYRIEADDVDYQAVDPDSVSETEIQNIIRHYKKLGKDENKYVESFNEIATQYTDVQLKLITKFLPLNVRAVLEEKSPKYQQVMIGSVKGQIESQKKANRQFSAKDIRSKNDNKIELIDKELQKAKLTKPVVIPSTIDMQNVKKAYTSTLTNNNGITGMNVMDSFDEEDLNNISAFDNLDEDINLDPIVPKVKEEQIIEEPKKKRGRPRKERTPEELAEEENKVKKGRGRPKKVAEQPKQDIEDDFEDVDLFSLVADEDNTMPELNDGFSLPGLNDTSSEPEQIQETKIETTEPKITNSLENNFYGGDLSINQLPGMENFEEEISQKISNENNNIYGNNNQYQNNQYLNNQYTTNNQYGNNSGYSNNLNNKQIERVTQVDEPSSTLSNLITGDKKIVAFVGTSKNGTSFLVNNLAANLSAKGINTAILDLTTNKNAYYIYTANEESLRQKAFECIDKLRSGIADGIQVNKNLTVYTTLPEENQSINDYNNILETLVKNYSLVLLDCDFNTNLNYFAKSQEIYLVQTYDILTIQPLTEFLNEMKYKNILDQNKLRIVINKTLKLRKLTDRMIIGGISCYNDPASTYLNTLFDKDSIRYTTIPFENQTYAKYLERLVDCEISLNGYSKIFLEALDKLSNMVYPLIASNTKYPQNKNYNDYNRKNINTTFNSNMNDTLNRMRKNF